MSLANNPTLNSASIFGLVGGKSPFQPTLTSAPASLAVQVAATSGGLSYSASALVFSAAYLNFPATQTLTVINNGPLAVGFTNVQIVGANASDFSLQASCPAPPGLPVGQTCVIGIGFAPSAGGVRNATLLVETNGVNSPQSFALSGTGLPHVGSSVTLSPSSLTFTLAGVPQAVTVTNNSAKPIALGSISTTLGSETNNCGAMLAAQSICTIEVETLSLGISFDNVGTNTGTLTVTDTGNPGVETLPVNVPYGSVNFTPLPINFGGMPLGVTSMANASNVASGSSYYGPAPPFSGSITGPNASDFGVGFFGNSYETTAYVTFTPTGLGARTATLVTNYGNIPLSGNGVTDSASFSITPVAPVSSQVGVSLPVPVTIQNTGSTVLYLRLATGSGDFVLPGTLASSPLVLVPAQSQSFNISFNPVGLGLRSATLTATDTGSGVSHSIPLTGTGDAIDPSITPITFTFSSTEVGVLSAAQTMTVSTPSGGPVSIQFSNDGYNNDFPLNPGTCATQTPCQISVSFKPSKTGSDYADYLVTDLVTAQTTLFTVYGSGGVGSVSLSSSSLTFAARDIGTTSISQTVTLTNTGDATLTISGETFSGANVGDFPIEGNTCGSSLAGGANCTLTISFDPTASGTRSAILQIMTNAASSPDNIQLMGTAN
ncbi:choice-of-anchor D domain-containing protein [Tunturiibacter gelidiferens]|uniref:Choice-of-anchor D domain-containing protein n=1 Tax=Tunturiibacter gelidiferens TaxID=3069689 RepID=A0AAU7Z3S6_9BACT